MVYFVVGLAVGSIATYFINKIWNVRETDSTETKKSPLSKRATTQPATSPSNPLVDLKTDISQKPQHPTTPSPQLTATPTIPIYLHPIGQVEEEFRANFEKVFGILHKNGSSLNLSERIDLILRNSSQSENFNLPDFFKNDRAFIGLYLKAKNRNSESEEKALRVANDHLKWLLTKDALFTQGIVGEKNEISTPKLPFEFSCLDEMEKAAVQIDQWKVTHTEKLRSFQTLDLRNLGLISVPDFIGQLSSLEKLDLRENQLFAIPLSLALLPSSCTITLDVPLDRSTFDEKVRTIRLTHPHLGPKIIMPT